MSSKSDISVDTQVLGIFSILEEWNSSVDQSWSGVLQGVSELTKKSIEVQHRYN